jgi:hypothetical protein
MVPPHGIEPCSVVYKTTASPQCFGGSGIAIITLMTFDVSLQFDTSVILGIRWSHTFPNRDVYP